MDNSESYEGYGRSDQEIGINRCTLCPWLKLCAPELGHCPDRSWSCQGALSGSWRSAREWPVPAGCCG